tara:strand:+ start:527 stop:1186 length:660 start_codon:yes stop_codon:yes gene_type:complete
MIELTATPRAELGKKLKALRAEGVLPGVVYSGKVASTPISVSEKDFTKILRDAGETALITLKGLDTEHEVLIQDITYETVKGNPMHVDFYAVERGKEVEVTTPLEFIGEAPAEKAGAQLVKAVHELNIKTTPGKIPAHIEVDLSTVVEVGDRITIADLKAPEGVTILNDAEDAIVVAQEHVEEAEEEVAAVDMDAIDVEQKGKGEEEGGEKAEEKTEQS